MFGEEESFLLDEGLGEFPEAGEDPSIPSDLSSKNPGWRRRRMLFFISLLSAMLFTVVLMFLTTSAGVASSSQFPTVQMSERFIEMLFGFAQVFLFFWLYAPCLWIFSYNAVDYVAAFALSDDHPEGTTSTAHALTRRPGCCHHAPHDYKRVLRL